MADEGIKQHGDTAAEFADRLADRGAGLEPIIDGERELDTLQQAAWPFEDEFGCDVVVRRAAPDDDLAAKVRPIEPAIPSPDYSVAVRLLSGGLVGVGHRVDQLLPLLVVYQM